MPQPTSPSDALSRRNFLALAGAVPVALAATSISGTALAAEPASPAKRLPWGIELYSVRGEMLKDLPATLRAVAKMGYEVVEFPGSYFAWTFPFAKDVRSQLDDLGMRCTSTHNNIASFTAGETMARAIELNQILGTRHIILASAPPAARASLAGWKNLCERLTATVEELKPHGLSVGFHNHATEWAKIDGELRIMDVIANNTPKEFILQLDVGTCVAAGTDPIAWIKANPGRIKSLHLKDWAPGERTAEKEYRVLFGEGVSPWKEIFAAAESVGGAEYYFLEQEGSRYPEFETAQRCLETWKAMRKG